MRHRVGVEGLERAVGNAAEFEIYASHTTGMSKTDPGWDTSDVNQIANAKITHGAAIFIFDFVVKQKLFNFFLLLGCVPLMAKHTFTKPWPRTIRGRSPSPCTVTTTRALAGSMYENKCTSTHNCGQVASDTAGTWPSTPGRVGQDLSSRYEIF